MKTQGLYTVQKPFVEMRVLPDPKSEVVSQAYYSEIIQVISERGEWVEISTQIDGYKGFAKKESFVKCNQNIKAPYCQISRLAAHIYEVPDTIYGPVLTLPYESKLILVEDALFKNDPCLRWLKVILLDGSFGYVQRGDVSFDFPPLDLEGICKLSMQFLGIPYTWGGRASFGYDCSGFVQMLYRKMGVFLPRDSSAQCNWDGFSLENEITLASAIQGDLVFFGHSPSEIRHVGLSLGKGAFIHTCAVVENMPYVRISSLSDSEWSGKGYYKYVTIKRLS